MKVIPVCVRCRPNCEAVGPLGCRLPLRFLHNMTKSLQVSLTRLRLCALAARRTGALFVPLRVGIAVRLTAAFAAVIILAAAANFLAEQGVAIVAPHETIMQPVPAPVVPTPVPVVAT